MRWFIACSLLAFLNQVTATGNYIPDFNNFKASYEEADKALQDIPTFIKTIPAKLRSSAAVNEVFESLDDTIAYMEDVVNDCEKDSHARNAADDGGSSLQELDIEDQYYILECQQIQEYTKSKSLEDLCD
ncbi:hypothetical protein IWQ62_006403, partial [Dispira parvispora]